jgi:hypothetical protein
MTQVEKYDRQRYFHKYGVMHKVLSTDDLVSHNLTEKERGRIKIIVGELAGLVEGEKEVNYDI